MQKRSHKQLASALLAQEDGFSARRFEWAFLFGSFQPDCNPLTYLKGSRRAKRFGGHNFSNARPYIESRIRALQEKERWTLWNYYTLGKLTHYLADAFTYPHNRTFSDNLTAHHVYERQLRLYLADYLPRRRLRREQTVADVSAAIAQLHREYLSSASGQFRDTQYILKATGLLMAACLPAA